MNETDPTWFLRLYAPNTDNIAESSPSESGWRQGQVENGAAKTQLPADAPELRIRGTVPFGALSIKH